MGCCRDRKQSGGGERLRGELGQACKGNIFSEGLDREISGGVADKECHAIVRLACSLASRFVQ
jgi:hypothetical protein